MDFLPKEIDNFICGHTEKEPQILAELNHETWEKVLIPRMLSGHFQGRVLSMLSHMIKPKNILEIGTYTGYSAICFAEGLHPEGKIHTIDINEELE
ncbi:methyltransferase, partial [bacterium]|nr:methyltransferase [bacterium]